MELLALLHVLQTFAWLLVHAAVIMSSNMLMPAASSNFVAWRQAPIAHAPAPRSIPTTMCKVGVQMLSGGTKFRRTIYPCHWPPASCTRNSTQTGRCMAQTSHTVHHAGGLVPSSCWNSKKESLDGQRRCWLMPCFPPGRLRCSMWTIITTMVSTR